MLMKFRPAHWQRRILSGLEQICKRLDRRAATEAALARADLLPVSLTFLRFAVKARGFLRQSR